MKNSPAIISGDPLEEAATECEDEGQRSEWRDVLVTTALHGQRLDRALQATVPEFSRSYLQQLLAQGAVWVDGRLASKAAMLVKAGSSMRVELRPTPQSQSFRPESMSLSIVFEDPHLLIINKPAGLVVHPAPGNWSGTLLNGLLAHDRQAATLPRAGIVHRLDKDTSGLMVVARTRPVMDALVAKIAARTVSRQYLALAHRSWIGPRSRDIEAAIGRDPANRLRMGIVDMTSQAGKSARTTVQMLQSVAQGCLLHCTLHTGRTHQIRVHLAAVGHPIVADEVYGGRSEGAMSRQALHAYRLAFDHPVTGAALRFQVDMPEDMQTVLTAWGLRYNAPSSDSLP